MPKQKTKKSVTKRFKVTKNGKVLRMQGFKRHLNAKKTSKRKRRLSGKVVTKKSHAKKIRMVLGKDKPDKQNSESRKDNKQE